MTIEEELLDVVALHRPSFRITDLADRGTIREHLNGKRQAGVRRPWKPDPLEPFKPYLLARFADNAHIWATALYEEVVVLGYQGSYVSFVRQIRLAVAAALRACSGASGRETIEMSTRLATTRSGTGSTAGRSDARQATASFVRLTLGSIAP
jgi:hypothetical protein